MNQLELPLEQRVEPMGYPKTSLLTISIGCRQPSPILSEARRASLATLRISFR